MGAQLSKGEATVDGNAVAEKANGQENGHVKINGDVSGKPEGDEVAADGNGTAEVVKETEAGDAIEAAPATDGDAAKPEGEEAKETKKKKRFSLKNSFKFKGISLKKNKKREEGAENAATPVAEEKAEDKPEENGEAATETKEEPAENTETNETPAPEAEAEPKAEDPAQEAEAAPTEETPKSEEPPKPEEPTKSEETPDTAETTPTTASDPEPATE
ncbi:MARCKS-related protein 1-A [Triplophysa dalaica]|uniref:MARCKS-related protein 1-A n=1 Tax=Triplophysa dalaica TaxID=1582913 RepID=UPI0024DF613F|nr:MARCKS-related protein 1-A [Triplophysa dalaica]